MRVVIAPDKFAGTLNAPEAAQAIAEGWSAYAPSDHLVLAPLSDGGPGFVDSVHRALGGDLMPVSVPSVTPTVTRLLQVEDTVYLESAQVAGPAGVGDLPPLHRSSFGVGFMISHARDLGARKVVVGVGGTSTNDGGAGLLSALGAQSSGADLNAGPAAMRGVKAVDLEPARTSLDEVDIVAATDVDSVLTGLFGATRTFGPQKGIAEEDLPWVDGVLTEWAAVTDRRLASDPGAGAGGGIGFGLMLLGARRESGFDLVAHVAGLEASIRAADLVITGEGAFDVTSRAGKVPMGVAGMSQSYAVPCLALAGRVDLGIREMRTMGIEAAYASSELSGLQAALRYPYETLRDLAERVARTWSR